MAQRATTPTNSTRAAACLVGTAMKTNDFRKFIIHNAHMVGYPTRKFHAWMLVQTMDAPRDSQIRFEDSYTGTEDQRILPAQLLTILQCYPGRKLRIVIGLQGLREGDEERFLIFHAAPTKSRVNLELLDIAHSKT